MLSKMLDEKQIQEVKFSTNNTVNRSTGETPAKLLFGRDQRGKIKNNLREMLELLYTNDRDIEQIRSEAEEK